MDEISYKALSIDEHLCKFNLILLLQFSTDESLLSLLNGRIPKALNGFKQRPDLLLDISNNCIDHIFIQILDLILLIMVDLNNLLLEIFRLLQIGFEGQFDILNFCVFPLSLQQIFMVALHLELELPNTFINMEIRSKFLDWFLIDLLHA
jgi:hypothetical protein